MGAYKGDICGKEERHWIRETLVGIENREVLSRFRDSPPVVYEDRPEIGHISNPLRTCEEATYHPFVKSTSKHSVNAYHAS